MEKQANTKTPGEITPDREQTADSCFQTIHTGDIWFHSSVITGDSSTKLPLTSVWANCSVPADRGNPLSKARSTGHAPVCPQTSQAAGCLPETTASSSSCCLHGKRNFTASAFPLATAWVPVTCSGHCCLQED